MNISEFNPNDTISRIRDAQAVFRATPDVTQGWFASYDTGGKGLAVFTPAETFGSTTAHDGYVMAFERPEDTIELIEAPQPIRDFAQVATQLGALGLSSETNTDLLAGLCDTMASQASGGNFQLTPDELAAGKNKSLLGQPFTRARIASREAYSGIFTRDAKGWSRTARNPITGMREVHSLYSGHKKYAANGLPLDYELNESLHSGAHREVIVVTLHPELLQSIEEQQAEVDNCINQVAGGQLLYGRFNLFFDKEDSQITDASISTPQELYKLDKSDYDGLGQRFNPRRTQAEGCFFVVTDSRRITRKGDTHTLHLCKMAGIQPKDLHIYFNGPGRNYIYKTLANHPEIVQIDGSGKSEVYKNRTE